MQQGQKRNVEQGKRRRRLPEQCQYIKEGGAEGEREREREREKEEGTPPTGKQKGNSRETKQNYRRLDRVAITCTCYS